MKASIIEVTDMRSVLTVDEVEKRFGEVSGVESATVNYAAGNATVRYDETLLNVAGITVMVHQRGHHSEGESQPKQTSGHKSAPAPAPEATVLKDSPVEPASAAPSYAPQSSETAAGTVTPVGVSARCRDWPAARRGQRCSSIQSAPAARLHRHQGQPRCVRRRLLRSRAGADFPHLQDGEYRRRLPSATGSVDRSK